MADTRERLLARPDIPDEDVDDIVARAAALQDAARADDGKATKAEVQAVAAELDIAPEYVDEAIEAIQRERRITTEREAERSQARTRTLRTTGLALVALVALFAVGVSGAAMLGSGRLSGAAVDVDQTASRLEQALDRQIALAPQLVALAGADATPVKRAADTARSAEGIDARLEAAATLNQQMAEAIGGITAAGDEQAQQRLLNLQHEIVGTWNRIDTERGRFEEARISWNRAAGSPTGALALGVGLASPPEALRP